jgi:hypothetical protein
MKRYENIPIIKSKSGKRRFASSFLPTIPLSDRDIYIVITSSQRLDHLAKQFYEDEKLWWVIGLVNNVGKGSLYVSDGVRLRIPPLDSLKDLI